MKPIVLLGCLAALIHFSAFAGAPDLSKVADETLRDEIVRRWSATSGPRPVHHLCLFSGLDGLLNLSVTVGGHQLVSGKFESLAQCEAEANALPKVIASVTEQKICYQAFPSTTWQQWYLVLYPNKPPSKLGLAVKTVFNSYEQCRDAK